MMALMSAHFLGVASSISEAPAALRRRKGPARCQALAEAMAGSAFNYYCEKDFCESAGQRRKNSNPRLKLTVFAEEKAK